MRQAFWAAIMLGVLSAGSAGADEPVRLRVADSLPAEHYIVRLVLKPWMDEVARRANGAVVFTHYPNQQLGKAADLLRLTQTGLVDVGYVVPSYASDKMPVSEVAQLPGQFEQTCQGALAYRRTALTGVVGRSDYAPNKVRLLLSIMLSPYHVATRQAPVRTAADLTGLKLRTTGGAQDLTARAFGAVPVRMAAPDAYESLSRGTLDGVVFPLDSVVSYGLEKLVRNVNDGLSFGNVIVTYSIGMDTWNRLPPEVRQVMDEVAESQAVSSCRAIEIEEVLSRRKLEYEGVTFNPTPAASMAEFRAKASGIAADWAKALDARGKPGTEALHEFDTLLRAAGN